MDRQKWLEWRLEGIGSSDAAAILGVSPYKTAYEIWEEKVFKKHSSKDNSSMKRGRDMEETARLRFEEMINASVFPKNVTHQEHDWIRASLDGIDIDGKVVVEIKCPSQKDHAMAKDGKVPEKYIPQVQHQLLVTGVDYMYYFSFDGQEGVIVEVGRDSSYICDLLELEGEFWYNVLSKNPPKKTERDVPRIECPQWAEICQRRESLTNEIKSLESQVDKMKEDLISMADGKSAKGFGYFLQNSKCSGGIDYESLKKDNPGLDLDKYRKPGYDKWTIRKA